MRPHNRTSLKGAVMPGPHTTTPAQSEPSSAPGAVPRRRWWRTNAARAGCVAAVPGLGLLEPRLGGVMLIVALVVLWRRNPWPKAAKAVATVAAAGLLAAIVPDSPGQAARDTAAEAKADGKTRPHGATTAPPTTGSPEATMPPVSDYRGQNLEEAHGKAGKDGFVVKSHDASEKDKFIRGRAPWTVCFQETGRLGARPVLDFAVVPKGAPCPKEDGAPIPWPTMPELVWKTWQTARAEVIALGVRADHVEARKTYRNDTLPDEGKYDDWRVCAHDPAEGGKVQGDSRVTLYLSSTDNGCPAPDRATGTAIDLPDRDDDGDPDYRDPFPGDRNRTTSFPDGVPHLGDSNGSSSSGGSSGGSHGHGRSVCPRTRWC